MAHVFQKMSPGMVTMASTDKIISIFDVSSLKEDQAKNQIWPYH